MANQGKRYDLIAADFAKIRDSFHTEKKYLDLFMSHLQPGAAILDVGCGSGYPIASYLIEHGFKVTGIDGSQKLLNIAQERCPHMKTIYGDVRSVILENQYDAIIEWWCLFHLTKIDQLKMLARFSHWLRKDGIVQFTTGDHDYEESSSEMLNQKLFFYSCDPQQYEQALKENGLRLLLKESDQDTHLVWMAKKL